jgi:hypothetical protein
MKQTATTKKNRTGTMPANKWYTSQDGVAAADQTFGTVKYKKKDDGK